MAAIIYSKLQLIQRIKKHIADGFPNSSFSATDNEVLLYIDEALAFNLIGQVYANAKIEGALAVPEAYLVTYNLTLSQDMVTGYWFSALPQPPVSLPLGYSISRVYPAMSQYGEGQDFVAIKAKRVSYRKNLPLPPTGRYWVENKKIWFAASDNTSLLGIPFYVQMACTRTSDTSEAMNLPDDAIEGIFQNVTQKLIQRMQLPKDIILDNLPAGNKSS